MSAISMLAQMDKMSLDNGMELRLVSAWEILDIRREAGKLASCQEDRGLCTNACLIAHALEAEGKPVFADGTAVLLGLSVEEIASLVKQWSDFNRQVNPGPSTQEEDLEDLKKN